MVVRQGPAELGDLLVDAEHGPHQRLDRFALGLRLVEWRDARLEVRLVLDQLEQLHPPLALD